MLWKNPIYKFRMPGEEESSRLKEIVIDVTGSAPSFNGPSDNLKRILDEVLDNPNIDIRSVLEVGAAKLKNVPYILNKRKIVCAVEFRELGENALTKKNLRKCKRHGSRFHEVLFPHPFIDDEREFDLALLANVIPVMPIWAERLYLLELLHRKAKYVLWIAQKEGTKYRTIRENGRNNCGDGIWMGKGKYTKTFYKHHSIEDLDEMMALYGFKRIKKFSGSDDAALYERVPHVLFKGLVTPEKILQHIPIDADIQSPTSPRRLRSVSASARNRPVVPNPQEFSIENLYIEKIRGIPTGLSHAEEYQRVVSHALARIFRGDLRNMEIKPPMDGGRQIPDAVFTNSAEKGFFKDLMQKVECSHPMVEAKNTSNDPNSDEINQLNGRFNHMHGHFGILACRNVEDVEAVLERCKGKLPENYILVLTDDDIIELLELSREGNKSEIHDFMDRKLRKLIF